MIGFYFLGKIESAFDMDILRYAFESVRKYTENIPATTHLFIDLIDPKLIDTPIS